MTASLIHRSLSRPLLVVLLTGMSACATYVRVPLAVPLPAVGGARPATPQGLQLIGEFGDGVWGQEQQRAEMVGGGLGLSLRDRVEFTFVGYTPTRTVRSSSGTDTGDPTSGVRGKIRFANLGGRISIGAHLAYMGSTRERSDVQNEQLTAWDLALPVEFYPAGDGFVDYRWGLYAGPRLVSQSFHDRLTGVTTEGTLAAALLGVVGRWRYFAATGELNVAHATPMTPGGTNGPSDWILLPMGSVRLTIPIGN